MDRVLYIAMAGARQTMLAQESNANNLANASTAGFRKDFNVLRSTPVFGFGLPARAYAMSERPGYNFDSGPLVTTGHDLDVAIKGDGWFAVQSPDGNEAYTRAGELNVDSAGRLLNAAKQPILGNNGPIALPPHDKVEIAPDGTINIHPLGQAGNALVVVDRIKLVNPPLHDLYKGSDGLFRMMDGTNPAADAKVTIASGMVESSNVNPVEELVQTLSLSREYESHIKMMHMADENDSTSSKLLQLV